MNPERALRIVKAMRQPKPKRPLRCASRPPYVQVTPTWTWANATPRGRAEAVRNMSKDIPQMTPLDLCDLYQLTLQGLVEILRGKDWKEEYCLPFPRKDTPE